MVDTVVKNTRDQTVATISQAQLDTSTPLDLIGYYYSGYGATVLQNIYRVMENFAHGSAPASPSEGMTWFDTDTDILSVYDGTQWVELLTSVNASGSLLPMLGTAVGIDFTSTGSTSLHTGATGKKTFVTALLLVPQAGAAPTGAPSRFALEVTGSSGDVMDEVVMTGLSGATSFAFYNISGVNRIVAASETVSLNISSAVGGGTLDMDAFLFGHVRTA